jgi:hypothetical protein
MDVKIVSDQEILQPVRFNSGPRIGRVQIVEIDGKRHENRFWYTNGGKLHHVDSIAL